MTNNIKAGYQLHVTTWENDGDNYKTQIFSGLTKADVSFYLEVATQFKSHNNFKSRGLGNDNVSETTLREIIIEALKNNPEVSPEVKLSVTDSLLEPHDFICELLGSPDEYYDLEFCRVFERATVYLIPTEMVDVTAEFTNV